MNEMTQSAYADHDGVHHGGASGESVPGPRLSPSEEAAIDDARRRGLFEPPPMVATVMELLNF
ncbi:MAG TPA: hypothetical protein VK665_06520 [Candidatus Elarobacter sp.]|nr:hypothetical protein [Candidatus Elarobacter sp.]